MPVTSACRPERFGETVPFLGRIISKSPPLVTICAHLWCPKQVRLRSTGHPASAAALRRLRLVRVENCHETPWVSRGIRRIYPGPVRCRPLPKIRDMAIEPKLQKPGKMRNSRADCQMFIINLMGRVASANAKIVETPCRATYKIGPLARRRAPCIISPGFWGGYWGSQNAT